MKHIFHKMYTHIIYIYIVSNFSCHYCIVKISVFKNNLRRSYPLCINRFKDYKSVQLHKRIPFVDIRDKRSAPN